MTEKVIIIGAGPAGLTAALEALRVGMVPIVLEAGDALGGISRTVNFKGYRMDLGGHRFFSKSDWVMDWWREILPIQGEPGDVDIAYQNRRRKLTVVEEPGGADLVMLVRNRLSRIYFRGCLYDYPIRLNLQTMRNLGVVRMARILSSYLRAWCFPRPIERTLEDFLVNRFGHELYSIFFRDYTEKVWGIPCSEISAEWGAQRIKGLSVLEAIRHAARHLVAGRKSAATKTSLIERFLYPRLGPGQLWEAVGQRILSGGGEIRFGCTVVALCRDGAKVRSVSVLTRDGIRCDVHGDHFISSMAVRDLMESIKPSPPDSLMEIARGLPYRDFITVGLLLGRMRPNPQIVSGGGNNIPPDNWIYIQDPGVRMGRLQIFNNWSPDLVPDHEKVWLGLEYFCCEGDELWEMPDSDLLALAAEELEKIGMANRGDVEDGTVIRVPKAYPAYFGTYADFNQIRQFTDQIENLYLIGRNGMHRYNNQDHSMLTAKYAIEAIQSGSRDKSSIWGVNLDDDYHEEISVEESGERGVCK